MLEKHREAVTQLISEAGFDLAIPVIYQSLRFCYREFQDKLEFEKIGAGSISCVFRVKLANDASIVVKLTGNTSPH